MSFDASSTGSAFTTHILRYSQISSQNHNYSKEELFSKRLRPILPAKRLYYDSVNQNINYSNPVKREIQNVKTLSKIIFGYRGLGEHDAGRMESHPFQRESFKTLHSHLHGGYGSLKIISCVYYDSHGILLRVK